MNRVKKNLWLLLIGLTILPNILLAAGCSASEIETDAPSSEAETEILTLPQLDAAELNGAPLKVIATTSIIGDVVAQVGGDAIQLTTLMGLGQDPHSYEPGARQLTAVSTTHLILVNGWDLEEALVQNLAEIGEGVPLAAISANIVPLKFGEDEQKRSGIDPHVWFSIDNVKQWVENVEQLLSDLDPANAEAYQSNAATYLTELEALEEYADAQLAQIPEDRRFLVTNHDSFGYFANEYNFTVLGTVIPGQSTVAEPSASDLTSLIAEMEAHNLCVIFTETAVNDSLTQTVAEELDGCEEVQVLPLYIGTLGPAGSGADSYIGMFRANVDMIVAGVSG